MAVIAGTIAPVTTVTCEVAAPELDRLRLVDADGGVFLAGVEVILLATSEPPPGAAWGVRCADIADSLVPISREPTDATVKVACLALPTGVSPSPGTAVWAAVPRSTAQSFKVGSPCWEFGLALGAPQGVETVPVACVLG